ncbi:MAG: SPOR domain-containing protein [Ignavibacteria bacterium]|nr:SPOR domain-containing protein [Ignavibacteria bacterium]MBT8381334.1 SPOR domain-containing protein [Ignavibacteria bacterium]MBT8391683.1 SPOR domain-containing protein [Ignavibacteria bacterium]NNJ54225.1 SPOR domain-containing protein [Ignavibacteriaceae bacterium]NNL22762.1 SPOR domain-containing protein [Ignavibacteriaceae bacterium]
MKLLFAVFLTIVLFYFLGCSASTGSRYEKKEVKNVEQRNENNEQIEEDFDITPYKTDIELETEQMPTGKLPNDVWYQYDESESGSNKKVIGTTDGYRVQVIATDDIEEANQTRSEIYVKTTNKKVYVNFEPPFYKVKVGDFTSRNDADDLKFMLNQLGYKESRVVQETVNLFE